MQSQDAKYYSHSTIIQESGCVEMHSDYSSPIKLYTFTRCGAKQDVYLHQPVFLISPEKSKCSSISVFCKRET